MLPTFIDFIRAVVDGDIERVSWCLGRHPALATTSADVGATRGDSATFFFPDIAHHLYGGDTALHMAAAAFRYQIVAFLIGHEADCRAKNRRGAEPLHYAADANRWDPMAQAQTIAYLISVGADPNALDRSGVSPLHRAVRTRSLAAVQHCSMAGQIRDEETRPVRPRCILRFKPRAEVGAALREHENNRLPSSSCCWNGAPGYRTGTDEAETCITLRRASGREPCFEMSDG